MIAILSCSQKKKTTARVPDSEKVFRTFRAQDVDVNCVDPASKVGHSHSEQLSQRPNVDPSNIDEALYLGPGISFHAGQFFFLKLSSHNFAVNGPQDLKMV
jgi:hypothetical protein